MFAQSVIIGCFLLLLEFIWAAENKTEDKVNAKSKKGETRDNFEKYNITEQAVAIVIGEKYEEFFRKLARNMRKAPRLDHMYGYHVYIQARKIIDETVLEMECAIKVLDGWKVPKDNYKYKEIESFLAAVAHLETLETAKDTNIYEETIYVCWKMNRLKNVLLATKYLIAGREIFHNELFSKEEVFEYA
uniref:Uncharacterized protein n=1 Tax=Clastoptera arizonana TaxID=38151 RepID=A0A1B6E1C6_9HEMI